MKAPTSTPVRRLVGSVRTATAAAVTRLASMSLASDTARQVEAVDLERCLPLLGERDLGIDVRHEHELLNRAEAVIGENLIQLRAR